MFKVEELIGIPFVEGGRDKSGLDCWGLVTLIYSYVFPDFILPDINVHCGISESKEIDNVASFTKSNFTKTDKELYSIILIKHNDPIYVNHVGVYLGGSKFIHTRKKIGVNIDTIESMAWKRKIEGYYIPLGRGNNE